MSDLALKNALLERDRIAAEINQIQQRVHDLKARHQSIDEWIFKWHMFAGIPDANEADDVPIQERNENIQVSQNAVDKGSEESTERTRATGNPKKELVASVARQIISDVGEPVPRSDLFRLLQGRGINIEGKDREQVLSTMLWRTRSTARVARLPSGGYWLAEVPHPASGYVPDPHDTAYQPEATGAEEDEIEVDDLRGAAEMPAAEDDNASDEPTRMPTGPYPPPPFEDDDADSPV